LEPGAERKVSELGTSILPRSLHFVRIFHRNLLIPRNKGRSQRFQHHLPTQSIYTYKDKTHTYKGKNNNERFGFIWWEKAVAIFLACVHYVKLKLFQSITHEARENHSYLELNRFICNYTRYDIWCHVLLGVTQLLYLFIVCFITYQQM
jgi:hypothetical protein